jgi:hypothetical protein
LGTRGLLLAMLLTLAVLVKLAWKNKKYAKEVVIK